MFFVAVTSKQYHNNHNTFVWIQPAIYVRKLHFKLLQPFQGSIIQLGRMERISQQFVVVIIAAVIKHMKQMLHTEEHKLQWSFNIIFWIFPIDGYYSNAVLCLHVFWDIEFTICKM